MRVLVDARIDARDYFTRESRDRVMHIPDDLVARILNASDQTARTSALLASKSLSRVASTYDDVWTEVTFRKLGAPEREFFARRRVHKLVLDGVTPEDVQHLFRSATNDFRRLFSNDAPFDRLKTLSIRFSDIVRLPADLHFDFPELRHLKIRTGQIERESTFVVRGLNGLETFEFHEDGDSPMVNVVFEHWNFPRLWDVQITCDQTNFADCPTRLPDLKRVSLRPYYASFQTSRWAWGVPLDFLELNVAENANDDALSWIRDVKHLVLRITESAYLYFRPPPTVERITFSLAASDCMLEFTRDVVSNARSVKIAGEHVPMIPWNVLIHGMDIGDLKQFCEKTDVGDDVLLNFVNVTA